MSRAVACGRDAHRRAESAAAPEARIDVFDLSIESKYNAFLDDVAAWRKVSRRRREDFFDLSIELKGKRLP